MWLEARPCLSKGTGTLSLKGMTSTRKALGVPAQGSLSLHYSPRLRAGRVLTFLEVVLRPQRGLDDLGKTKQGQNNSCLQSAISSRGRGSGVCAPL